MSNKKLKEKVKKARDRKVPPSIQHRLDSSAPDSLSGEDDSLAGNISIVEEFLRFLAFYYGSNEFLVRMKHLFDTDEEWLPSARQAKDGLLLMRQEHGGPDIRRYLLELDGEDDLPDSLEEPPEDLWD